MSLFISIIAFILILGVLVVVHEFGHFIVAKKSGIKVEEFGFGFPPRAMKLFRRGETLFTLNWIPLGGFVKIFGENGEEAGSDPLLKKRSFVHKSKWIQTAVLFAGPFFNFLFAWLVLSIMLFVGTPALYNEDDARYFKNTELAVVDIVPDSPAKEVGLQIGDQILSVSYGTKTFEINEAPTLGETIQKNGTKEATLSVERKGEVFETVITPTFGLYENQDTPLIGVTIDNVGTLSLPIHKAFIRGMERTWDLTASTAIFLFDLIKGLFTGDKTNVGAITGPVGIVPVVGDALSTGFSFVLVITALISINLAIINLLPFPALDGGRLLFILIEVIKGSKIKSETASLINSIGFFILIGLMLLVTIRDIVHLF